MDLDKSSERLRAEQVHQTPFLEKLISLLGLVIVLSVLSIIAYEAKIYDDKPPEISIEAKGIIPQEKGYLLKVTAKNKGSQATAAMVFEGVVGTGEEKEVSTVTFDYVPAHSTRDGGLFFQSNPEGAKLRAMGYQEP